MKKLFQNFTMLPLIIIITLLLVIYKVKTKAPVEHQVLPPAAKSVQVIILKKQPFQAQATAYGYVEPEISLDVKAEVSGKISYIHPGLKRGGSLAKGTIVLRIEPTTFEFSLDQNKAGLMGSQSSLQQLKIEEKALQRSLSIAQKNLQVGEKELSRLHSILKKDLIARSVVDTEQQKTLQLRQQVADLQGKLAAFASRKRATKAKIKQSRTKLAQSKDTLQRTEVVIPFDARIGNVLIEKDAFTSIGGLLFEALGTQAIEINAQLPTRRFRPLLSGFGQQGVNIQNPEDLQRLFSQMHLQTRVSLVGFHHKSAHWQGQFVRIAESIDPSKDTIDLIVRVKDPYQNIIPGKKPPLLKGMYVAVEFIAPPQIKQLIPRKAIHQGRVYLVDKDNKLSIKAVKFHVQGQIAIIEKGLSDGDKVILTDVIPVLDGLPVRPVLAQEEEKKLTRQALGQQLPRVEPND